MKRISDKAMEKVVKAQKDEINGHLTYLNLSKKVKNRKNARVLRSIAEDELKHYRVFSRITKKELKPDSFSVFFNTLISRIFGLTFGIKLMERGEGKAQLDYKELGEYVPEIKRMMKDEEKHEKILIKMLDEERLRYVGSMVLGLNDALVELTGSLAGLSFAFQDTRLIALSGLIMGIAASLSMAASEYLSTKAEGKENAGRASLYTGAAYIITVFLLVAPYFLLGNYMTSLLATLAIAIIIIMLFNFYVAVAKELNFRKRFLEMAGISLGVSAFSFMIGVGVRVFLGIDV